MSERTNSTRTRDDLARCRAFISRNRVRSTPVARSPRFANAMECRPGPQHKSRTAPRRTPVSFMILRACSSAAANRWPSNMYGYVSRQNASFSNHSRIDLLRDGQHALENQPAVFTAEDGFARALGMRHETEDVSGFIADTGDV